jgi:hypothetical protein
VITWTTLECSETPNAAPSKTTATIGVKAQGMAKAEYKLPNLIMAGALRKYISTTRNGYYSDRHKKRPSGTIVPCVLQVILFGRCASCLQRYLAYLTHRQSSLRRPFFFAYEFWKCSCAAKTYTFSDFVFFLGERATKSKNLNSWSTFSKLKARRNACCMTIFGM